MLPGIGTSEYVIIAVIALVVVGPKDLPMLMRKVGQFVAKARNMASDFRASFDDMARQSELEELRKEVEAMRSQAATTMGEENQAVTEALTFEHDPMFDSYDPYADTGGQAPDDAPAGPAPDVPVRRRTKKAAAEAAAAEIAAVEPVKAAPKPRRKKTADIVT